MTLKISKIVLVLYFFEFVFFSNNQSLVNIQYNCGTIIGHDGIVEDRICTSFSEPHIF